MVLGNGMLYSRRSSQFQIRSLLLHIYVIWKLGWQISCAIMPQQSTPDNMPSDLIHNEEPSRLPGPFTAANRTPVGVAKIHPNDIILMYFRELSDTKSKYLCLSIAFSIDFALKYPLME